uniref:Uncharacterized protein n=1 Tax=Oryza brachyantha TaxID=4533 RepID=J3LW11_ORYBR
MPTVVAMAAVVALMLMAVALAPPAELVLAHAAVAGEGSAAGTGRQQQRPPPPALFVPFRARVHRRRPPAGRAVKGCMPRGHRVPPSAPSRYVNYHTLDAGMCDDHGGGRRKP